MINENSQMPKRIPIRFVDEENRARYDSAPGQDDDDSSNTLTPDELGRASIYEDATEMQRRIDRGGESDSEQGKDQADDRDTAGGPSRAEMPENLDHQDTNPHDMSAAVSLVRGERIQAQPAQGGGTYSACQCRPSCSPRRPSWKWSRASCKG
jgi:hypothetical protein